tara:strand:+ start:5851 stop:9507 length:3657 start_codon:yes stop_codon:yes gene_type:complete
MALPTIKIAVSNGHFQESLQNYGDRGTWTAELFSSPNTILTDANANWVENEWADYSCVVDTNGTNNVATIVSNTETTITVSGNQTGIVTPGTTTYRIAGGLTGTVTANGTASTTITVSGAKNKWNESKTILADELIGMTFVPDKLDGTAYAITDNTATTITIGTAIAVTATTFEIGRGASATVYPEELNISAELNEAKQMTASVLYDVVGTNKFEQDTDIDNPLMLGSTVRVSESTGGKMMFDGIVHDCPTDLNADTRAVQFTAYDNLAILDYTMIPGTKITSDGDLPTFAWSKATPLVEAGAKGWASDNKIFQTKALQDYSYAPQPFAMPIATTNGNGTWTAVQITNTITGTSSTFQYSSGGLDSDIIKPGCVVFNLTREKATYVESVDSDTQITCVDSIWQTGNRFVILSCNWQNGEGVTSDADYSAGSGYAFTTGLREQLEAPANNAEADADSTRLYVGRLTGTRDVHIPFAGRGWVMISSGTTVELVHYNGYIYDFEKDKYYLNAYNTTPAVDRNTRGDLTNSWKRADGGELGIQWIADSKVNEIFPNRFGGSQPLVFDDDKGKPFTKESYAVTASEGAIHFSQGENKWDGKTELYAHQYSYDGDASSSNPDKGTSDDAIDISDLVQIATTGLLDSSSSLENIINESKQTGGAGLVFDTTNSKNTGIYVNNLYYKGFEDSGISKHPKEFIEKLCDDSGLIYDLRYDDINSKVIFKPLLQQSSPDITFAAGSLVSLARERDVSDVYSAILLQVQTPEQNYFDPQNVAQYGTGVNNSGTTAQSGFTKGSYSSGSSIPDYFWDVTHMRGLGPDVESYDSATKGFANQNMWFYQSVWKKCLWQDTSKNNDKAIRQVIQGDSGIPTVNSSGVPLHVMTFWFRDAISLDADEFTFRPRFSHEGHNGATYRIEVTTGIDVSDPLSASTTWQYFNDNAISTEIGGSGWKSIKLNKCQVKGINGIRISALASPFAQNGWVGENRMLLRQTDADLGFKTYGYGGAAETFSATLPQGRRTKNPRWNGNRQDAWGLNGTHSGINITTAFQNALDNTEANNSGTRAGYVQTGNMFTDFSITGVGKKALFVRTTKAQRTKDDVERLAFSPAYKKVASMGYKIDSVKLDGFSKAEAQGLGQQYLDDKLRRFQARDYSLEGKSPFVNSNDLPYLGQTIRVADDTQGNGAGSGFTGILSSYNFTFNAEGTRFDFRLEDYDRNNTAQYIQAG